MNSDMTEQLKKCQINVNSMPVLHSDCCHETYQDVEKMKSMLSACPELINNPANLLDAVRRKHVDCVKFLLENEAKADATNDKNTPLATLVSSIADNDEFNEIASLLLKFGANPNAFYYGDSSNTFTSFQKTPLIAYPLVSNNANLMKLLLEHGANPNVRLQSLPVLRDANLDCLTHAIDISNVELTELLLKHGAQVHNTWNTFVLWNMSAISGGNLKLAKVVLMYQLVAPLTEVKANVSISAVRHEVSSEDLKVKKLKILYEFGFDFQKYYSTFVRGSRSSVVNDLLKNYGTQPRALKSSCRLAILQRMARKYVGIIDKLEIPYTLNEYLKFNDV